MEALQWIYSRPFGDNFLYFNERYYNYGWLRNYMDETRPWILNSFEPGEAVCLLGDYGPETTALIFLLLERRCILFPKRIHDTISLEEDLKLASIRKILSLNAGQPQIEIRAPRHEPEVYRSLRAQGRSGLVISTSGSSGKVKCLVHDFEKFLGRTKTGTSRPRIVLFLNFDHLGGLSTLFYSLAQGGTGIVPSTRTPDSVLKAAQDAKAEILPVTPSFLYLVLCSGASNSYLLDSLRLITYGAERMTPSLLWHLTHLFPNASFKQTYGMSELGVVRTRSERKDSVRLSIDPADFQIRVVEGRLFVKGDFSLLADLSGERNPDTAGGWLDTGDYVQTKGEWLQILGREDRSINTGGLKVAPVEVEKVLMSDPRVLMVRVKSQSHSLLGNCPVAEVRVLPKDKTALTARELKRLCIARLPRHAVPVRIHLHSDLEMTENLKMRDVEP